MQDRRSAFQLSSLFQRVIKVSEAEFKQLKADELHIIEFIFRLEAIKQVRHDKKALVVLTKLAQRHSSASKTSHNDSVLEFVEKEVKRQDEALGTFMGQLK